MRRNPYVDLAGIWVNACGEFFGTSAKIIDGVMGTVIEPAWKRKKLGIYPTCFNCGTESILYDPSRSFNKFICPNCKRVFCKRG